MSIENTLNYIRINDRISTSGQPSPLQFEEIAEAGFSTVINLAMPDSTNALPDEGGFVSEVGMNYFHIPVSFEAPRRDDLILFLKLMKILEGQNIWVHCALNMRVSAFMQHYQKLTLKLTNEKRVPMLNTWEPEKVWLDFLKIEISETF